MTHYFFDDCIYYTPAFSDEALGRLALRDLVSVTDGRPRTNTYLGEAVGAKCEPQSAIKPASKPLTDLRRKLLRLFR